MLLGRTKELASLQESYDSGNNTFTVLYGRTGIGKTALLKEFIKDKECLYYVATQASKKQQLDTFAHMIDLNFSVKCEDYTDCFIATQNINSKVKLIIIEEFQNIIKQNKEFVTKLMELVEGKLYDEQVMVVCTSSSISWIESNLVSVMGAGAASITGFLKLKELAFVDIVRMFKNYSVPDCMTVFAITGGVPSYMKEFSDELSIKENICNNVLKFGKKLRTEGNDYIKEELRETALYNTILSYIAVGNDKLNDLHVLTGFGRDKISVYLKNLIEREIVEKVFSYDSNGNEHTRKGLYHIKCGFTEFWFRYIYGKESLIEMMEPEEFYDNYIADTINDFAKETFVKVGAEFIGLMDSMERLPINIERRGRWWGKNGDIDIIACDRDRRYLIGKCNWLTPVFTFKMFEELMYNIDLAGVGKDYIFLFSKDSFDEELTGFASEHKNVNLVSLNDL